MGSLPSKMSVIKFAISLLHPRKAGCLFLIGLAAVLMLMLVLRTGDVYQQILRHSVLSVVRPSNEFGYSPVEGDFQTSENDVLTDIRGKHVLENGTQPEVGLWFKTQNQRRSLVQDECSKMDETTKQYSDMETLLETDNIYVDLEHKVLYCAIPKVACSSWKGVIAFLTGAPQVNGSKPDDIADVHDNNFMRKIGITQLSDYSSAEASHILATYTKFMMVRHPMERLVSAYRDKFQKDNKWTRLFQKKYGRKIIRLYRKNPSVAALFKGNDVTFQEFVSFITDPSVPFRYKWNPHWSSFQRLCLPCLVKYDYILKYDTFDEDARGFLKLHYAIDDIHDVFPKRNAHKVNSKDKAPELFNSLPRENVDMLFRKFHTDFQMFGYPMTVAGNNV